MRVFRSARALRIVTQHDTRAELIEASAGPTDIVARMRKWVVQKRKQRPWFHGGSTELGSSFYKIVFR